MAQNESLGILGIESVALVRARPGAQPPLLHGGPGLRGDGRERSPSWTARGGSRAGVFQAGDVVLVVSQPLGEGGRASRYLRSTPTAWAR